MYKYTCTCTCIISSTLIQVHGHILSTCTCTTCTCTCCTCTCCTCCTCIIIHLYENYAIHPVCLNKF